jgi:hypothetical protein
VTYKCTCCGEIHDDLPDLSFDRPSYASDVPDYEFEKRVKLNEDLCVVDDEFYFIRGVIKIPIHDYEQDLGFGVWVSQKKENYETYLENYDTPDIGPFFGWLSNEFKFSGEPTLRLKTMVHFQGDGQRPLIELDESNHPLSLAQRNGISLNKAWKIAHDYLG